MISFFGNYYGGLVVKNLEKVFYMICGVALVFVGIIIGGLIENDANAQTEPNPEYRVLRIDYPHIPIKIESGIDKGCQGGYIFHQMVVTNWNPTLNYAEHALLIFKKK